MAPGNIWNVRIILTQSQTYMEAQTMLMSRLAIQIILYSTIISIGQKNMSSRIKNRNTVFLEGLCSFNMKNTKSLITSFVTLWCSKNLFNFLLYFHFSFKRFRQIMIIKSTYFDKPISNVWHYFPHFIWFIALFNWIYDILMTWHFAYLSIK